MRSQKGQAEGVGITAWNYDHARRAAEEGEAEVAKAAAWETRTKYFFSFCFLNFVLSPILQIYLIKD